MVNQDGATKSMLFLDNNCHSITSAFSTVNTFDSIELTGTCIHLMGGAGHLSFSGDGYGEDIDLSYMEEIPPNQIFLEIGWGF